MIYVLVALWLLALAGYIDIVWNAVEDMYADKSKD